MNNDWYDDLRGCPLCDNDMGPGESLCGSCRRQQQYDREGTRPTPVVFESSAPTDVMDEDVPIPSTITVRDAGVVVYHTEIDMTGDLDAQVCDAIRFILDHADKKKAGGK